ncbi:MAG: histidinol dehydrogenase [Planctomycetota bacterium]|jgi:histidinol dehydrogenase
MIKIYSGKEAWKRLEDSAAAPGIDGNISGTVGDIISAVRKHGDAALREFAEKFGDAVPDTLRLSDDKIEAAVNRVPEEARKVIIEAEKNIRRFAEEVMDSINPVSLDFGGWTAGLDFRPVESAGCYVPGGRYPLPSTALMTAVTAQVAGVRKISITSPGMRDEIVFAGRLAGVKDFYNIGGAQAIAALAFGTVSIDAVDMIVGPGNAYVTEAKRRLQGTVGIDMLAGPSEVAIIADKKANPEWVALDMLAQAEHDPDAKAWLITDSKELGESVAGKLKKLSQEMELPEFLSNDYSGLSILVFDSIGECVKASEFMAPEHLQLAVSDLEPPKPKLRNYGALFMGYSATVPFGDYTAGPNHTLPTGRTARFAGGLTPLTFLRPQSWIAVEGGAEKLSRNTASFAEIEGLKAHAAAARARLGGK